jgi:hypothetical protein
MPPETSGAWLECVGYAGSIPAPCGDERIPAAFLGAVADLLDIPHALRRGTEAPAVDGTLWHLGKARIGPVRTDVWLVRGLASSVAEVFRYFHGPALPDQGLILTSGQPLPEFVRPPRNYRFAPLRGVLVDY